jgi:lysophospholipase L1-like esterase
MPDLLARGVRLLAGVTVMVALVLGGAAVSLSNTTDAEPAPGPATGEEAIEVDTTAGAPDQAPDSPPLPLQVGSGADVLVLGDSLAVALYPYLGPQLPDRRVTYAAQEGRATSWAATRLAEELRSGGVPPVIVVSSGTNDGSDADLFRSNAERVLERAGAGRCVVWLTVHVPNEEARSAINAEIERLGERDNVAIADWATAVESEPSLLIGDRVHATRAGLQVRSELIAEAVHRCSPYDPDAPPPAYVPPPTDTRMPASTGGWESTSTPSSPTATSTPQAPSESATPTESPSGETESASTSTEPSPVATTPSGGASPAKTATTTAPAG